MHCTLQEEVKIIQTNVFVNPFDTLEQEAAEAQAKEAEKAQLANAERGLWYSHPQAAPGQAVRSGIGKYLPTTASASSTASAESGSTKKRAIDFGALQPEAKRAKAPAARDAFANW
jgi:hypothetical protein